MFSKVDLHIHSTYSDGCFSPEKIVSIATLRRVRCISITDHDNIYGIKIAAKFGKRVGLEVIPGIELSVLKDERDLHILGYYFDIHHPQIVSYISFFRDERLKRAQKAEFLPWKSISERITQHQKVHFILAEICHNHFFEAIAKSMLKLTREIVEAVKPDHKALHTSGEHEEIIEAVVQGDSEAAATAMNKHLDKFCSSLVKMEEAYRQRVSHEQ